MTKRFAIKFVENLLRAFQVGVAASCLLCTTDSLLANDHEIAQLLSRKGAHVTQNEDVLGHPITEVSIVSKNVSVEELRLLGGLKHLEKLSLWGCPILDADLLHLRDLTQLKSLDLTKTKVTGEGLDQLPESIERLLLSDTKLNDSALKMIARFRDLTELTLANTEVSDVGLEHLGHLSNLESLALSNTYVTDAGVQKLDHLHKLHSLNLDFCPISDANLSAITEMKTLKELSLTGTDVSNDGLKRLKLMMPGCKVFPSSK